MNPTDEEIAKILKLTSDWSKQYTEIGLFDYIRKHWND